MLLDPFSYDCALPVADVETNTEKLADGTADDGGYIDSSAIRKRKGNVDGLPNGQRHGRFELHATNRKVAAFGGHTVRSIVAPDSDGGFERDARRAAGFAAELKLSFSRYPLLWGGTAAEDCEEQNASHNSSRY